MLGCRDQQRLGAGEVAVHRLPCHAQRTRYVGDAEVGPLRVDGVTGGVENSRDCLVIRRGRRTGPAVGTHAGILVHPRYETDSSLTPLIHPDRSRCGSASFAIWGIWSA